MFLLAEQHTWWAGAGSRVSCCLSQLCAGRGWRFPACSNAAVGGGRWACREEQPGLKKKFWGRRRCWEFTESTQHPFWPTGSPLLGSSTCQALPVQEWLEGKQYKEMRHLMTEESQWRKGDWCEGQLFKQGSRKHQKCLFLCSFLHTC